VKHLTTLFVLIFLLSCSVEKDKDTLTIACAANMQFAMDSIAVLFEEDFGISCEVTYGSSGMLTTQIESGAPYDLFISANAAYPDRLYQLKEGEKPVQYANGRLLFVYPKEKEFNNLESVLLDETIRQIGVADDRTAPYGIAAMTYLKGMENFSLIEPKLVVGESIGQVNQYITTGAVDAAFTSYAFRTKFEKDYQFFEVDQAYFNPIVQKAMTLYIDDNEIPAAADKMMAYLQTGKCKAVLNYFGYLTD
jgi:molybdate transport system substrate-binding protein